MHGESAYALLNGTAKSTSGQATSSPEVVHVRDSLERLRWTLSKLPWLDGRPVMKPERRIRVEVAETEAYMAEHMRRKANAKLQANNAPVEPAKNMLLNAFKRMEDERHGGDKLGKTGDVTIREFAYVWNSIGLLAPVRKKDSSGQLMRVRIRNDVDPSDALSSWRQCDSYPLWDSDTNESLAELEATSKGHRGKQLLAPKRVTEAHAAALFLKHGYDKEGLMPYDVFVNALLTPPAHLEGMRELLDQRARGINGFEDGQDADFDGKILYPKSRTGVFSPSDFNADVTVRSSKPPSASMRLEYVHGFEGQLALASNAFYTDNPDEVVYYVAALGVVLNTQMNTQRFFFGHTNDITSIAQHPCKWIICTGQNKAAGPTEVPFVCVWETRGCRMLQQINHPFYTRSIIAAGFSAGGRRLVTVTSDNSHSVFVWNWMTSEKKLRYLGGSPDAQGLPANWPKPVSGWHYGSQKKLNSLAVEEKTGGNGFFFRKPFPADMLGAGEHHIRIDKNEKEKSDGTDDGLAGPAPSGQRKASGEASTAKPPVQEEEERHQKQKSNKTQQQQDQENEGGGEPWMEGVDHKLDPPIVHRGYQGKPSKVYGAKWHPRSDTFITYGFKHLKFWYYTEEEGQPRYEAVKATHSAKDVDNVLSAAFAPDPTAPFRRAEMEGEDCPKRFVMDAKVSESGKVVEQLRNENTGEVTGERLVETEYEVEKCTDMMIAAGFAGGDVGIFAWVRFGTKEPKDVPDAPNNRRSIHVPRAHELAKEMKPESYRLHLVRVVSAAPSPRRGKVSSEKAKTGYAHHPGKKFTTDDGSFTYGGVCAIRAVEHSSGRTLLYSGGADGQVIAWDARQVVPDSSLPDGLSEVGDEVAAGSTAKAPRIARLRRASNRGPWFVKNPYRGEGPPIIKALDVVPGDDDADGDGSQDDKVVVGTNMCELLELSDEEEDTVQVLNTGHTDDVLAVALHPFDSSIFATAAESSNVKLWDAHKKHMKRATSTGFRCRSVTFSREGGHLAVGGKLGRVKILKTQTMQPLSSFKPAESGISEVRYSPNNRVLAVASHDTCIDLYDTGFRYDDDGSVVQYPGINSRWFTEDGGTGEYVFIARCEGHSGTIWDVDFSLPLAEPASLRGRTVIATTDSVREILYFDMHGRSVQHTLRDAKWDTRSHTIGFDVMGIWEDYSGNFDVNSLDRDPHKEHCVTGDNFSLVKLFNYPVTHNDAPYRAYKGHASFVMDSRFSCDGRKLITAGGRDRAVLQFSTHGICKQDSFHGRRKDEPHCDVAECLYCGRQEVPPVPPPLFGPLDAAGRTWGPISYSSESGECDCANCEMRFQRELDQFDPDGDGFVKQREVLAALRGFGERAIGEEDVEKLVKRSQARRQEGFVEKDPLVPAWIKQLEERRQKSKEKKDKQRAHKEYKGDNDKRRNDQQAGSKESAAHGVGAIKQGGDDYETDEDNDDESLERQHETNDKGEGDTKSVDEAVAEEEKLQQKEDARDGDEGEGDIIDETEADGDERL